MDDSVNGSDQVLRQGAAWVNYERQALDHDIAVNDDKGERQAAKEPRDLLVN